MSGIGFKLAFLSRPKNKALPFFTSPLSAQQEDPDSVTRPDSALMVQFHGGRGSRLGEQLDSWHLNFIVEQFQGVVVAHRDIGPSYLDEIKVAINSGKSSFSG